MDTLHYTTLALYKVMRASSLIFNGSITADDQYQQDSHSIEILKPQAFIDDI